MAVIIDGKKIALEIREKIKQEISSPGGYTRKPGLAVILVGENPASKIYVKNKRIACEKAGFVSKVIQFEEHTSSLKLIQEIQKLNSDNDIDGILVQLPLPPHIDEKVVFSSIAPDKDVDGFSIENMGALIKGIDSPVACTPAGCIELIKSAGTKLDGANAVIVGRSNIVGKPMAMLLLKENATVTICHSHTRNLKEICREADVLVAAIGKPKLITSDMVKPGATVIDVGINRLADGSICGDVDYEEVSKIVKAITPVPGGVGPMTIAMLLKNTYELYKKHINS